MDKVIKSLARQHEKGTLQRNTTIALRALSGEKIIDLAAEYHLTHQRITNIVQQWERNQQLIKESKALAK